MIGLPLVAPRARDLDRTRRFYEEGLDLVCLGYRRDSLAIDLGGGANVTLLPFAGPARPALDAGHAFIHLSFLVGDLDGAYHWLLALDAAVVQDDVKERSHDRVAAPAGSFKALDPNVNVIDVSDRAAIRRSEAEPGR